MRNAVNNEFQGIFEARPNDINDVFERWLQHKSSKTQANKP